MCEKKSPAIAGGFVRCGSWGRRAPGICPGRIAGPRPIHTVSPRLPLATLITRVPGRRSDMTGPSLPALSRSFLDGLRDRIPANTPANIELPAANLLSAPETILQIGSGAFLKAFVEDFVQLANIAGDQVGRVVSVQRTSDHRSAAFLRQDGLYTLILRGIENGRPTERRRIIASISRSLSADTDWNKVMAMAVRPSTRVIVSNVTEIGLALGASDAPTDQPPPSFPGKLTQLLRARWQASGGHTADATPFKRFRGKPLFGALVTAPLVMPDVILGFSLMALLAS